MFNTAKDIIETCEKENKKIYDLVIADEIIVSKTTEEAIRSKLDEALKVMVSSATGNLNKVTESKFNMIDGFAKKAYEFANNPDEDNTIKNKPMIGDFAMEAMAMAFSTSEINCAMGEIVAAPTAGSAGILPAAMVAAHNKYNFDQTTMQNGLLTAIGIGQIIAKYATFAGAEGGCQAECGAASAMAAAALTEMRGGSAEECLNAASITLINVMGLVCDPIAGLVQFPCTFRNASGVINAITSSDIALAGIKSIVPFDQVVQAMGEVGHMLNEDLRETGLGGIAGTKTGCKIREEFLNEK